MLFVVICLVKIRSPHQFMLRFGRFYGTNGQTFCYVDANTQTLYAVLIDWLVCIFLLCEYNTKMNSSKTLIQREKESEREYIKLSYFNQIWINSMDNEGTRKLEINL